MAITNINSQIEKILSGVTADGAGAGYSMPRCVPYRAFQSDIAGTGAVSATVTVEGSIDGSNWSTIATISLTGTTTDSGIAEDIAVFPLIRGRVASISGTGATINLWVAI